MSCLIKYMTSGNNQCSSVWLIIICHAHRNRHLHIKKTMKKHVERLHSSADSFWDTKKLTIDKLAHSSTYFSGDKRQSCFGLNGISSILEKLFTLTQPLCCSLDKTVSCLFSELSADALLISVPTFSASSYQCNMSFALTFSVILPFYHLTTKKVLPSIMAMFDC